MSNVYIMAGKEYTIPEAIAKITKEMENLELQFCMIADSCEHYNEDTDLCYHKDRYLCECTSTHCPYAKDAELLEKLRGG